MEVGGQCQWQGEVNQGCYLKQVLDNDTLKSLEGRRQSDWSERFFFLNTLNENIQGRAKHKEFVCLRGNMQGVKRVQKTRSATAREAARSNKSIQRLEKERRRQKSNSAVPCKSFIHLHLRSSRVGVLPISMAGHGHGQSRRLACRHSNRQEFNIMVSEF